MNKEADRLEQSGAGDDLGEGEAVCRALGVEGIRRVAEELARQGIATLLKNQNRGE